MGSPNITASLSAQSVSSLHPCCSRCPHHGFCSPQSYSCYHSKDKEYYASCGSVQPSCCSSCPHHGFCSPQSHSCYHSKRQWYYEDCGPWVDQPTSPRRRSASTPSPSAWRPSGWCPSFDNRGWHPGDCRKHDAGSWYMWICTVGGVTHFCSSDCAVCQT